MQSRCESVDILIRGRGRRRSLALALSAQGWAWRCWGGQQQALRGPDVRTYALNAAAVGCCAS